jgi:hypothetical protein
VGRRAGGGNVVSRAIPIEQRRIKYAATINDESLSEATEPDDELHTQLLAPCLIKTPIFHINMLLPLIVICSHHFYANCF